MIPVAGRRAASDEFNLGLAMPKDSKKAKNNDDERLSNDIKYTSSDDGSWRAETDLGAISKDSSGLFKGSFDEVRKICIGDITTIKNYNIDRSERAESHFIEFKNGGFCRLTYKSTGEVIEFKVGRVDIHISHEKVMTITG
jgi:hypothetical protein